MQTKNLEEVTAARWRNWRFLVHVLRPKQFCSYPEQKCHFLQERVCQTPNELQDWNVLLWKGSPHSAGRLIYWSKGVPIHYVLTSSFIWLPSCWPRDPVRSVHAAESRLGTGVPAVDLESALRLTSSPTLPWSGRRLGRSWNWPKTRLLRSLVPGLMTLFLRTDHEQPCDPPLAPLYHGPWGIVVHSGRPLRDLVAVKPICVLANRQTQRP